MMPPDVIEVILKQLATIDKKLDRVADQQHENALKIRGIESRMAAYASMAALFVVGIVQAVEHVFF